MIAFALAILAFTLITALALGLGLWLVHMRGKDGRQRLAQESHDRSLALDRRCDAIDARLEELRRLQVVDQLAQLIDRGEREGRWQSATGDALRDYVRELQAETMGLRDASDGLASPADAPLDVPSVEG